TVMISSKAVYADDAGRHSNSDESPRFDRPVSETQATLAAGYGDYRTRGGTAPTRSLPSACCSTAACPSPCCGPRRSTATGRARLAGVARADRRLLRARVRLRGGGFVPRRGP